jgi:3-(3-hydroxy-phenyl)propionate hydroxylase
MTLPVLIVGAGPVGLTTANLLVSRDVPVILVERNATTSDEAKAISLDDESLRTFDSIGLADRVLDIVVPGTGTRYFDRKSRPLFHASGTWPARLGYPIKNQFAQPELERLLLDVLCDHPRADIRFSTELVSLTHTADQVIAGLRAGGADAQVAVSWVLGCDGGRSAVRELTGITMSGVSHNEPWLVVDTTGDTHDQRYGMHYGRPARPTVIVPGRGGRCRYEFRLQPGEGAARTTPDFTLITRLLAPYRAITPEQVERATIYTFNSLVADRWRTGRCLLLGDAAHMMPPFAGQGLNSGVRDAANLAWKVAEVWHRRAGEQLLDTYESERRSHAAAAVRFSARLGTVVMTTSKNRARLRDLLVRALLRTARGHRYLTEMRFRPPARHTAGLVLPGGQRLIGTQLPRFQVLVPPELRSAPVDSVLGHGLAVLGFDVPPESWQRLEDVLRPWAPRRIDVAGGHRLPTRGLGDVITVAADWSIDGELSPVRGRFLLVKPDRYIAAVFDAADEVLELLRTRYPVIKEDSMGGITGLGHTGFWVDDLSKMRDFYHRVLGLTITDEDEERGIVFFSARPGEEHHEFVLQRGRTAPPGVKLTHQVSWRVDSLATILAFHQRFRDEGVEVQQEVTHGNAIGIYFFDPEGNRNEVYLRIERDVRQPFRKTLNLDQDEPGVLAEAQRLLTDGGPNYQPAR